MTPSVVALVIANAIPILGVLFLGWTVFPLVLLYWLENVVVGGFNVAKLVMAQPREPAYWLGKFFLIPFFLVHFGGFTYIHGVLGEYQRASLNALMAQPYGRVMVLHMTVLFGGWVVMLLGSPLFALLLLVGLKTAADWRAHQAERRKFGA